VRDGTRFDTDVDFKPNRDYRPVMPLLPALQEAFEGLAKMADQPPGLAPAEARAWMHEKIDEHFTALNVDRPPVASEVDHRIPVAHGEVTARVYRPDADAALPCYLYLHGGASWLGTLDQSDSSCRGIATDAECVVVSLDYRLAPEHKFPIATEDCYAALLWIVEHADDLGVDLSRIAVGGGSTGGNLAAVVALRARDRDGPDLVLQVLEVAVGAAYAQRLRDAGIPVEAAAYHDQVVTALRRAFGTA
jgi:acetyl esterase